MNRWKKIVDSLDTDGDGRVSYEEFKAGLLQFIDRAYSSGGQ